DGAARPACRRQVGRHRLGVDRRVRHVDLVAEGDAMHIDRRGLLKTAVALTAAGIGCGSPATPRQAAASLLEFEFGGLFGVALWPRKKKAAFLLVSASDAEHVPMLTVPLSNWIPGEGTPEPLVVHAGTETFAAWPLSGFRVWVADFNAGGY